MYGGDSVARGKADLFLCGVQNGRKGVGLGKGGLSAVSRCNSVTFPLAGYIPVTRKHLITLDIAIPFTQAG